MKSSAANELGNEVEISVTGLAYGGSVIGKITAGESAQLGKKALVNGAIPGELVRAEIVEDRGNLVVARFGRAVHVSSNRVAPPCKFFGECGGCDYQHISLEAQREGKRQFVEDTLKHHGRVEPAKGVQLIGAELPGFGYRRKIRLHLDNERRLGFYRAESRELVLIDKCLIAHDRVNEKLAQLTEVVQAFPPNVSAVSIEDRLGEFHLEIEVRRGGDLSVKAIDQLLPGEKILELFESYGISFQGQSVGSRRDNDAVESSGGGFFQVNEDGNKLLLESVMGFLTSDSVTEFYAGAGNFSIPLAAAGKRVLAVEVDPRLVKAGQAAAEEQALTHNLKYVRSSTERFLTRGIRTPAVLLDPPRSGASALAKALDPLRQREVVYVSCNVPTLARDLKIMQERGYTVESVKVVDMFAQTHHVETVTLLLSA